MAWLDTLVTGTEANALAASVCTYCLLNHNSSDYRNNGMSCRLQKNKQTYAFQLTHTDTNEHRRNREPLNQWLDWIEEWDPVELCQTTPCPIFKTTAQLAPLSVISQQSLSTPLDSASIRAAAPTHFWTHEALPQTGSRRMIEPAGARSRHWLRNAVCIRLHTAPESPWFPHSSS